MSDTSLLALRSSLLALLASCAILRGEEPSTVEDMGLVDLRGVLHCHSHFSHDSKGSDEEIIRAARKTGIDFIFMSDHPSEGSVTKGLRGRHGSTWFFPGAETRQLLACDLQGPIDGVEGTQGAIDAVLTQGGLPFIAHPEEVEDWDLDRFVGMEIYNLHADTKDETPATWIRKLLGYRGDPEWIYTVFFNPQKEIVARWDRLTRRRRVVGVAGNDAHQNIRVLGMQLDPYPRTFRFVQTHVFAERQDHDPIVEHLAAGHAYVSFGLFGDPEGFSFAAHCGDEDLLMGDEARWKAGTTLRVVLPREAEVRVVRDGRTWKTVETADWTFGADRPGVYRVEAWTRARGKLQPWIYSNPIYLRE